MWLHVSGYGSVTNAVLRLLGKYELNPKEERYQGVFCLLPDLSLSLIGTGKQIFSNDEGYTRNLFVATLGPNGMFRASFTYPLSYTNIQITNMHSNWSFSIRIYFACERFKFFRPRFKA